MSPGVEVAGTAPLSRSNGYYDQYGSYSYTSRDVFEDCYSTEQISSRAVLTESFNRKAAWLQVWQVQREDHPTPRSVKLRRPAVAGFDAQVWCWLWVCALAGCSHLHYCSLWTGQPSGYRLVPCSHCHARHLPAWYPSTPVTQLVQSCNLHHTRNTADMRAERNTLCHHSTVCPKWW
jgi:hypothetical protein